MGRWVLGTPAETMNGFDIDPVQIGLIPQFFLFLLKRIDLATDWQLSELSHLTGFDLTQRIAQ